MTCPSCHRTAESGDRSCRSCGRTLDGRDAERLLTIAAVLGREFGLNLLERVSGHGRAKLLEVLDEDRCRTMLEAAPGVARFRFIDEQARAALYRALNASQRAALHRAAGDALEHVHADDLGPHLSSLADHFCAAAADGDARKAIDYSLLAGARAHASLDHEQAARHHRNALEALDSTALDDDEQRYRAHIGLAEALGDAGERDASRAAAERALTLGRKLAQPELVARCALAFAGRPQPFRAVAYHARAVALLEEALACLDERDGPSRARVLGRLAEELTFSERHERMRKVAHEALAMARRQADPAVLAYVLRATHWALWGPSNPWVRIALSHEILAHSAASDERTPALELDAHLFRLWALIEIGDVHAARSELSGCARIADRLGQVYSRWLVATTRVCLAFTMSALESVPALAEEAYRLGNDGDNPNAALFYGIQLTYLQWLRGDLSDAVLTLRGIGESHPLLTLAVRAALADTYAELGRRDDAHNEFEAIAARGFKTLPRNLTWTISMSFLGETCSRLGDVDRAAEIYALLEPLASCNLLLVPIAAFGAASHVLGLLATTMKRWADAERHFDHALEKQRAMATRHMLARTECEYAAMLLERRSPDDRARALDKLAAARVIAGELGMRTLLARIELLETSRSFSASAGAAAGAGSHDRPSQGHSDDGALPIDAPARASLRREGDWFTIEFAGAICRHADSKGLRHIALLLRHPEREIDALEMVRICAGVDPDQISTSPSSAASAPGWQDPAPSSPDALEDAAALQDYRRELRELREDLDTAQRNNDSGQVAILQERIEELARHLASSVVRSGKSREFANESNRARQAVRKAIVAAIRRIHRDLPELGRHLQASIKTGARCRYEPGRPARIRWEVDL